jgi:hypothetical protein
MSDADTIDAAIEGTVTKPKSVSVDGMSVTGQNVDDLIKASKYLRNKGIADQTGPTATPVIGIRMMQMRPPGGNA